MYFYQFEKNIQFLSGHKQLLLFFEDLDSNFERLRLSV